MPRKINTRTGEIIPIDPPEFRLDKEQTLDLAKTLGLTSQCEIEHLTIEIQEVVEVYFSRLAQYERGPSRMERNAALRRLAKEVKFVPALMNLNHASESALLDAVHVYPDRTWRNLKDVTRADADEDSQQGGSDRLNVLASARLYHPAQCRSGQRWPDVFSPRADALPCHLYP